jgi:hypothetical protein
MSTGTLTANPFAALTIAVNFQKPHHRITVLEHLGFFPDFRQGQRVAFGVALNKQAVFREQLGKRFVIEHLLRERSRATPDIFFAVRRVGEDEIKFFARRRELGNANKSVLHANLDLRRRKLCRVEIPANELRVLAGFFNAMRLHRAATQTFQTQRARPGKHFQNFRADDALAEAVENRLPHQIRRGANVKTFRHFENGSCGGSANDAHEVFMGEKMEKQTVIKKEAVLFK